MTSAGIDPHDEIARFEQDDRDTRTALLALSGAASLTDSLATDLLCRAGRSRAWASVFLRAVHACDFVIHRNSEWHIAPRVRDELARDLKANKELSDVAHSRLYEIAASTDPMYFSVSRRAERSEGDDVSGDPRTRMRPASGSAAPLPNATQLAGEIPAYLSEGPGLAYHGAVVQQAVGLAAYAAIADAPLTGQQWLASRLAQEQVEAGIIASDAIEVLFLQGMVAYREQRRREAIGILRRVATSEETRPEVAISAHLVGRFDGRRYVTRARGEALLRMSLEIGEELGHEFHMAQVLHTLGQLVGRDPKRASEAEELLRQSLEIGEELGHEFHMAQVLHTLGQLVGRDPKRAGEAEELLRQSLEMLEALEDGFGEAQVLHTLGQLVGRDPKRAGEAEELLRQSLEIGEELKNANHQAQVLYSMAQLPDVSRSSAEALLRRSLALNTEIRNQRGQRIVQRALLRLHAGKKPTFRRDAPSE
jgi:tetratricopeptide (TPR) repeat protein